MECPLAGAGSQSPQLLTPGHTTLEVVVQLQLLDLKILIVVFYFIPAIYELSCEAYKHLGKTSNYYWIDPDGSGALGPLKVYCNMTEDKVWTTVYHDLQPQTSVVGNSLEKLSVLQLNYSATMDQISAITSSAEYCEQFISYSCKMSRLLNTPDTSEDDWQGFKDLVFRSGRENERLAGGDKEMIHQQYCDCRI
ncbi:Contactin-associated protein-like 2 [Anas platyrhynchos]|uniref:Contactin-associated protein-like 2 n=1 Tax=Anas platyrhynchos TaxID=8839 RepID=R0KAM3_ANAPL|nr:Contactin-associated protein-like 2 [Anas platyrhynchos]